MRSSFSSNRVRSLIMKFLKSPKAVRLRPSPLQDPVSLRAEAPGVDQRDEERRGVKPATDGALFLRKTGVRYAIRPSAYGLRSRRIYSTERRRKTLAGLEQADPGQV